MDVCRGGLIFLKKNFSFAKSTGNLLVTLQTFCLFRWTPLPTDYRVVLHHLRNSLLPSKNPKKPKNPQGVVFGSLRSCGVSVGESKFWFPELVVEKDCWTWRRTLSVVMGLVVLTLCLKWRPLETMAQFWLVTVLMMQRKMVPLKYWVWIPRFFEEVSQPVELAELAPV